MRAPLVVAAGLSLLSTACSSGGNGSSSLGEPIVLQSEHFAVEPGEEVTLCQVIHLQNAPMDWQHISSRMVEGSHHLILYRAMTGLPGYEAPAPGLQECTMGAARLFVYGAQTAVNETTLPEGIGGRLDENEIFILEIHIANAGETTLDAWAEVTINPADPKDIDQYSGILFYLNTDFSIPPGAGIGGAEPHEDSAVCAVPNDVTVFRMQSHAHKRMKRVDAWHADTNAIDKQHIYKNEDWHSPVSRSFVDPPLSIAANETIKFTCAWENETENPIEFGESVNDEMCIVGLGYYPRIEPEDSPVGNQYGIDMHGNVFCLDGELWY